MNLRAKSEACVGILFKSCKDSVMCDTSFLKLLIDIESTLLAELCLDKIKNCGNPNWHYL